jgi:hypothetical protein
MLSKRLDPLPSNMKDFIRTRVFLHKLERANLAQRWCSSPRKKLRVRQYSLRQQTQFQLQKNMLAPLASNIIDSLTQATLQLQFSLWGHCEQRWCFSLLKTLTARHYSLTQETQFTMQSKLLDPLSSNMKDFIQTRVFLHSLERAY